MEWDAVSIGLNYVAGTKTSKITEAYKNTGLLFAKTTCPHVFAPCHLYSKTQAEG